MIALKTKKTHIDQLIVRCKKGDSTAQMQIYNNYYKAMYNILKKFQLVGMEILI